MTCAKNLILVPVHTLGRCHWPSIRSKFWTKRSWSTNTLDQVRLSPCTDTECSPLWQSKEWHASPHLNYKQLAMSIAPRQTSKSSGDGSNWYLSGPLTPSFRFPRYMKAAPCLIFCLAIFDGCWRSLGDIGDDMGSVFNEWLMCDRGRSVEP